MNLRFKFIAVIASIRNFSFQVLIGIFLFASFHTTGWAEPIAPASPPPGFRHQYATVNNISIHYVIGGNGQPLVLIHGFGQNWYMWNRLLPELSKHFTVIVPDLRGVGESGKPTAGYDKKTMASDIHELIKKLGYTSIDLAGHDIGLMVAYAYAAQYGNEVKKVALLDALIPGIEPYWTNVSSTKWHFGFFERPIAASLVQRHERELLEDFWPQQYGRNKAPFYTEEIKEFIRAYTIPGSITGGFNWYKAFTQDVIDNQAFIKQKLQMPMLTIAGEYSAAPILGDEIRLVSDHVKEIKLPGAGHWVVQEQTEEVLKAFLAFFMDQ